MTTAAIVIGVLCLAGIVVLWVGQLATHDALEEIKASLEQVQVAAGQNQLSAQRVLNQVLKIPVAERTDMIDEDFMPEGDRMVR